MTLCSDYRHIRGVNYALLDDADTVRRELAYGKRLGLNSVRFWLVPEWYYQDPKGYTERVRRFIRLCYDCGYTSCPILWNGNFFDPSIFTEDFFESHCRPYTVGLTAALKDEPGLLMWDVMNEPEYNPYCLKWEGTREEQEAHFAQMWDFVRKACAAAREGDPDHPITVGHAKYHYVPCTEPWVDILSFHDYSGTREDMEACHRAMQALSARTGKPLTDNETGCIARANPYDAIVEISERYGCGYYLYELTIHDYCASEHGIFYPDGTLRDPSTAAAIAGCHRNRDTDLAVPRIPWDLYSRGQLETAIARLRRAMTADPTAEEDLSGAPELARTKALLTGPYAGDEGSAEQAEVDRLYARIEESALLDGVEYLANLLEATEAVPLYDLPSAKVCRWRQMPRPERETVLNYAYAQLDRLKAAFLYPN